MNRVALVIGNSEYLNTGKLNNPKNDANDIASILGKLNFDVEKVIDIAQKKIFDLAENKGLKTNVDELIMNDKLELEIDGKTWYMVFINLRRCIPYDTYVDEIEPLLKYN